MLTRLAAQSGLTDRSVFDFLILTFDFNTLFCLKTSEVVTGFALSGNFSCKNELIFTKLHDLE